MTGQGDPLPIAFGSSFHYIAPLFELLRQCLAPQRVLALPLLIDAVEVAVAYLQVGVGFNALAEKLAYIVHLLSILHRGDRHFWWTA